jgi:septal ring factor EnvC (AmiA/AmiB activator)
MEKSMGFSQLEAPRIDRYRLVREEDAQKEKELPQNEPKNNSMENETIEELKGQIKALNDELSDIKNRLHELEDVGA